MAQEANQALRGAVSARDWVLAITLLLSAAMRPEELTAWETDRVVSRLHELQALVT